MLIEVGIYSDSLAATEGNLFLRTGKSHITPPALDGAGSATLGILKNPYNNTAKENTRTLPDLGLEPTPDEIAKGGHETIIVSTPYVKVFCYVNIGYKYVELTI